MKKLLLLCALSLSILGVWAQESAKKYEFTNKVEVLIRKGAKSVNLEFSASADIPVFVDWGDGKIEKFVDESGNVSVSSLTGSITLSATMKHEYAEPLKENAKVTIEGKDLLGLSAGYYFSIADDFKQPHIGFGEIDAPKLKAFVFYSSTGNATYTCKYSDQSIVDLSKCSKLEYVLLENVPALKLDPASKLKAICLRSFKDLKHEDYAAVSELDIAPFTTLTRVHIESQNIEVLDFSKTTEMKDLKIEYTPIKAVDFSKMTKLEYIKIRHCMKDGLPTLSSVELPVLPKLNNLFLSFNHLKSLKGFKNDIRKNSPRIYHVELQGNELGYNDLPPVKDGVVKDSFYWQYAYAIPEAKVDSKNRTIDLSDVAVVTSGRTKENTTITWFTYDEASKEEKAIEEAMYTVKDAKYTFKKEVFGGKKKVVVFAKLKNTLFPYMHNTSEDLDNLKLVDTYPTTHVTFAEKCLVVVEKNGEGTVELKVAGEKVESGAQIYAGTEVEIIATPAKGFRLEVLKANNKDIKEAKKFVVEDATNIYVVFKKDNAIASVDKSELSIYPNPASDKVAVKGLKAGVEVKIFTVGGKCVELQRANAQGELILNVRSWLSGSYIVVAGEQTSTLIVH